MENPLLEKLKSLDDPRPHLNEARDALSRMAKLQKDLLFLEAETRSWNQLRRILFGLGAILTFEIGVMLTLFWAGWGLHEAGLSPWWNALIPLFAFGALTAVFFKMMRHYGRKAIHHGES